MVITYSTVWIHRVRLPILLVVSRTGKMNIPLSPYAPENLVSRGGLSRPVPRLLHTQAEYGAYSRDSSRFPRRRPFIYFNRHIPSSQSRVHRVTQLCTDGVHCRESAGKEAEILKVIPVTGAVILQFTMDQLLCASFFHTHYWYEVVMLIEGTYLYAYTYTIYIYIYIYIFPTGQGTGTRGKPEKSKPIY